MSLKLRKLMPHERERAERECLKLGLNPNEELNGPKFDAASRKR